MTGAQLITGDLLESISWAGRRSWSTSYWDILIYENTILALRADTLGEIRHDAQNARPTASPSRANRRAGWESMRLNRVKRLREIGAVRPEAATFGL